MKKYKIPFPIVASINEASDERDFYLTSDNFFIEEADAHSFERATTITFGEFISNEKTQYVFNKETEEFYINIYEERSPFGHNSVALGKNAIKAILHDDNKDIGMEPILRVLAGEDETLQLKTAVRWDKIKKLDKASKSMARIRDSMETSKHYVEQRLSKVLSVANLLLQKTALPDLSVSIHRYDVPKYSNYSIRVAPRTSQQYSRLIAAPKIEAQTIHFSNECNVIVPVFYPEQATRYLPVAQNENLKVVGDITSQTSLKASISTAFVRGYKERHPFTGKIVSQYDQINLCNVHQRLYAIAWSLSRHGRVKPDWAQSTFGHGNPTVLLYDSNLEFANKTKNTPIGQQDEETLAYNSGIIIQAIENIIQFSEPFLEVAQQENDEEFKSIKFSFDTYTGIFNNIRRNYEHANIVLPNLSLS